MLLIRQGLETTKENDGIRELVYPAIKREGVAILDLFLEGVLTRVHKQNIEILSSKKLKLVATAEKFCQQTSARRIVAHSGSFREGLGQTIQRWTFSCRGYFGFVEGCI